MHHPSYFCLEEDWSWPCQVSEGEVLRNGRCLGASPLFRARGGGGSGGGGGGGQVLRLPWIVHCPLLLTVERVTGSSGGSPRGRRVRMRGQPLCFRFQMGRWAANLSNAANQHQLSLFPPPIIITSQAISTGSAAGAVGELQRLQ